MFTDFLCSYYRIFRASQLFYHVNDGSTQKHLENSKELMFVRFDRHIPGRMCLELAVVLNVTFEWNKNLEYERSQLG